MSKKQSFSLSLFAFLLFLATLAGILVFSTSLKQAATGQQTLTTTPGNRIYVDSGQFDPNATSAVWLGQSLPGLTRPLADVAPTTPVLGESSDKWIEIDLNQQKVRAHQGDQVVYEFLMSSGKFAPTPTGEYAIWYKVKYTKMEGGVKGTGTYYYLPNVPYTMFFYKGFGLHGTYWHNNFGQPMSHGCVNLPIDAAQKLFDWADPIIPSDKSSVMAGKDNPGTRVVVHGKAPRG